MVSTDRTSVTLAILPFENLAAGSESDIFCKSFSIDLITELSRFKQFQIIAGSSIKDFDIMGSSEYEAFHELKTDYFIQGSFRGDSNLMRINAQLINTNSRHLVWADRFEGKSEDLLNIQEDLLKQVVATLQRQLNYDLLSLIKKKPMVNLKAYECWLYGMEEVKKGSLDSDKKAREYFRQAIDIDSDCSLAYSGMSLTYFNEWSCQLWDRWELSQSKASDWAKKAIELDEQNYVAALVLGRIFLFEGAYETAEHYLRKSLLLNPNDADNLIQIASCFTYLGYGEEAFKLYEKALRLNPASKESYYSVGAFILFELGEFEKAVLLSMKTQRLRWVDTPVFFAAAHFELGNYDKMGQYWRQFIDSYTHIINKGTPPGTIEAVEWMLKVNPYRNKTNLEPFWRFVTKGGVQLNRPEKTADKPIIQHNNIFQKESDFWKLSFDGTTIQLPEVKGLYDLQKLIGAPTQPVHCAELMGTTISTNQEPLIDEKAKKVYKNKIIELREEIDIAERESNFQKSKLLQEQYDQLIEHLSQTLGLKGKVRQAGNPIEKARSAVTWRIRNAISKIEKTHPSLGKHLSNTINTGTFCAYEPEKMVEWILV